MTDDNGIDVEKHLIGGIEYEIIFVPAEYLPHPALWGCAYPGNDPPVAHVRNDLKGAVRRFTIQHELYHLRDPYAWGGTLGAELRANFVPACSDPFGFLISVWGTLKDRERRKLYWDMMRGKARF